MLKSYSSRKKNSTMLKSYASRKKKSTMLKSYSSRKKRIEAALIEFLTICLIHDSLKSTFFFSSFSYDRLGKFYCTSINFSMIKKKRNYLANH